VSTIRERPCLLADTGPFCRFAEAGSQQTHALADYLGQSLYIAQDVSLELRRRAKTQEHAALKQLQWIDPKFPQHEPIPITDKKVLAQIEDILAGRRRRNPGHFMEDRGEVATILLAKDRGWPVLMDDGWGRRSFAPAKGVEVISTEELCIEMAVANALSRDHAFAVFKTVYKTNRTTFDRRVAAFKP
jgi:predicted nucleic acid-binding protein